MFISGCVVCQRESHAWQGWAISPLTSFGWTLLAIVKGRRALHTRLESSFEPGALFVCLALPAHHRLPSGRSCLRVAWCVSASTDSHWVPCVLVVDGTALSSAGFCACTSATQVVKAVAPTGNCN